MFLLGLLLSVSLASPVRIAPAAPGLEYKQPQLAVSNGLVAVAFGAGNAVYFAASRDNGHTFSKPVKVAEEGVLSLGRHRGPRIAITSGAIVISAVSGVKGKGADGDLLAWRSTDGGETWSKGVAVNDVPGAAREGLHAMAAGPGGMLFATWLDLRQKGTRLYGATSKDGGATWSKTRVVYESPDGHICECCHPSAAVDAQGAVYVAWRNWLGGSRDIYLARSTDGGATFGKAQKLGMGTWPLNACPMDGGGLALAPDGKPVTAWRRDGDVFLDRPGAAEQQIGSGKDPAIAAGPDGPYVVWSAGPGLRARIPGAPAPIALSDDGAYASVAGATHVFAAWESKGTVFIQPLR